MYVNFFVVIVAAIAGFGVGALWYSPWLFSEQWQRLIGGNPFNAEGTTGRFSLRRAMVLEFVALLITSFVLANLELALGVHGPLAALRLGVWVWIGFQATLLFSGVLFERRPLELFYINAGERLAALLLMSAIIGTWQ